MNPAIEGGIVLVVTLLVLLSGAPVAFGLGAIALVFIAIFEGFDALNVAAETFYGGLNDFTLVSIPMANQLESLNAGVAASVTLYAIARARA